MTGPVPMKEDRGLGNITKPPNKEASFGINDQIEKSDVGSVAYNTISEAPSAEEMTHLYRSEMQKRKAALITEDNDESRNENNSFASNGTPEQQRNTSMKQSAATAQAMLAQQTKQKTPITAPKRLTESLNINLKKLHDKNRIYDEAKTERYRIHQALNGSLPRP